LTYLQKILEFVKIQKEDDNPPFPFEPLLRRGFFCFPEYFLFLDFFYLKG